MKVFRIIAFIILIISNLMFYVYGWIQKSQNNMFIEMYKEMAEELETKDQKISELEKQLNELEEKTAKAEL